MKHSLLFSFLLLCGTRLPAQEQARPLAVIPFTVEKSCIYFYCKVNNTDSLKFLFDTGADGSVINSQSIGKVTLVVDGQSRNIGANGSNMVQRSSDNTLYLGGLAKTHTPFTIIPYTTTAFDGVFGTDLMRDEIIEIDYFKKELRFYATAGYRNDLSDYRRCRLYFPGNYLSIKSSITVKGKKHRGLFGLDTGADNLCTMAAPFSAKHRLPARTVKIGASTSQGSDGSTYETPLVLIPEITFGPMSFYRIYADLAASTMGGLAVTDKAGFFGNGFLKRFNTVLDIKGRYIYFRPNNNLYTGLLD